MISRFKHIFRLHTPDNSKVYVGDDYKNHAPCIICGIDLTETNPWDY